MAAAALIDETQRNLVPLWQSAASCNKLSRSTTDRCERKCDQNSDHADDWEGHRKQQHSIWVGQQKSLMCCPEPTGDFDHHERKERACTKERGQEDASNNLQPAALGTTTQHNCLRHSGQ